MRTFTPSDTVQPRRAGAFGRELKPYATHMHFLFSYRMLVGSFSLLLLTGCASAPPPASHVVAIKLPLVEYRCLDGVGSDRSPEAEKLRQDGWVFIGYNRSRGDIIAIDEDSAIARGVYYGKTRAPVMQATFKREYK